MLTTDTLRRVVVREHRTTEVDLSEDLAFRIQRDGHLGVSPVARGRYVLKAGHKVGVLRYDDVEIRIVPKVSIGRLLYLASYHRGKDAWREDEAELGDVDDPLSAVAHAFAAHAERALRPTPIQGYRTHETAEWNLRGRLLFERQISRQAGLVLPAEIRYDEYELNIVENQLIKGALAILEPVVPDAGLRRRLTHLRFRLDGVDAWRSGVAVPDIIWTRLNERYRSAIALAKLILEQRSLELHDHSTLGTSFLFNMNAVFESFLTERLAEELEPSGGRVAAQHPTCLDEADEIKMKPDITWWKGEHCQAVIDAKYKRVYNENYPNADAYQMLAYCTRLGLSRGWLVYADLDGGLPTRQVVRYAGVGLEVDSIDLGGDLDQLHQSIADLASRLVRE